MSDKKIILLAFGVTFVAIMTYVICFWGTGVSKSTTDWGAFGNYLAVGVSIFFSSTHLHNLPRTKKNK